MKRHSALFVSLLALGGSVAVVGQQAGAGLLIRNGRLVDGTGGPSRAADVRIEGDVIVEVGPSLTPRAR